MTRSRQTSNARLARRLSLRACARGLTLVELIIGLAIMGFVLMALASFTTAVATGWKASEQNHKTSDVGTRLGEQLQETVSNMLAVVHSKEGTSAGSNAYLFYWKKDAFTGTADAKAQFGEMGLLEYDATKKSLFLYEPKTAAAMNPAEALVAAQDNWGSGSADTIVQYYKSSGVAAAAQKLAGPATDGSGATVDTMKMSLFVPRGAKPMVSYDLKVTSAGGTADSASRTYGSATLRSYKQPTNIE